MNRAKTLNNGRTVAVASANERSVTNQPAFITKLMKSPSQVLNSAPRPRLTSFDQTPAAYRYH